MRATSVWKWGLIFGVWTLLALLFSGPSFLRAVIENRVEAAWSSLFAELIFSYFWFALSPLALWLTMVFRIEHGKWLLSLTMHGLTSLGFSLVHSALFALVSNPLGWYSQLTPWDRYLFLILNQCGQNNPPCMQECLNNCDTTRYTAFTNAQDSLLAAVSQSCTFNPDFCDQARYNRDQCVWDYNLAWQNPVLDENNNVDETWSNTVSTTFSSCWAASGINGCE